MDVNAVLQGTLSPGTPLSLASRTNTLLRRSSTNCETDATVRGNAEQQLTQAADANFVCTTSPELASSRSTAEIRS